MRQTKASQTIWYLLMGCALFPGWLSAQQLRPGFDPSEYLEALKVSAYIVEDSTYTSKIPPPEAFSKSYRSGTVGLDNVWEMWEHKDDPIALISLRGTTINAVSWLENLYAAMVPAQGELQLEREFKFSYALSPNPKAAIHVGWLIGMAYLYRDMEPKIAEAHRNGIKDFLIVGHSQGGGIAYLLTAHLRDLQAAGKLSEDMRFKTYCSAAPKPGNLYFAYSYEDPRYKGWAYNVVNAKDWVPEVPMSIQTTDDFNAVNPFANAKQAIDEQRFPKNIALRRVYNQLDKPAKKARKNYRKYLGTFASKAVTKQLPEFEIPDYYMSNHYVRTGETIVLLPDDAYVREYPDDPKHPFLHHLHQPYLRLTLQLPTY
ncbi:MAG: lipase family protein [Lunatimonas sp.]|uniref:lipase family protein n=1 Tax=Lunatimonas sp. TaxID=2060141 RepID=UPI00263AF6E3|nr:lipase family protein [Lunatimonas sp.]MCC5936960.1 lipase family protein [Lunatimonas sp.]